MTVTGLPAGDALTRTVRHGGAVPGGWQRTALRLSWLQVLLMAAAACAGLVVPGVYGEPASTASMWRGYNLVTLVVAVPLLVYALLRAPRGSLRAQLMWVGVLGYAVYDYALYLFGGRLTDLFLLHAAVFSCSIVALGFALSTLDPSRLAAAASRRMPVRTLGVVLALIAAGLGGMWAVASVRYAATGRMPTGSALVETDTLVQLGMALDLALLVPLYATAAVLLWRRAGWGYALAGLALVSGTMHQVGYLVALPFQVAADIPGATGFDPGEPVIAAAFLLAAGALLAGLRHADSGGDHPTGRSAEGVIGVVAVVASPAGRVVESSIDIAASAQAVFDYVTDVRREPEWNRQLLAVEKLTPGPIGVGTRYRVRFGRGVGAAIIENTAFDRPRRWSAVSTSRRLDVDFHGRTVDTAGGCRLSARTELHPRGALRVLAPVLRAVLRRSWDRDLRMIKTIVEG
jgi:hypothetical protein